ncbi:hypothetical protein AYL99_06872 [Fonsecaea erecta]|uniref:Zn(2)-C6 fungal-type domain-containing protein n=1 Tax=Fonsecaea erecta TaxID=1367422 RepID=A0A178ZIF4_9EURO|nr:hypothetical protein AYL99_06872 [Fonsecaea erecta]OAP59574.1 hypothetical protein AYL99_06872 [Fonsecaea erecta]
MGQHDSTTPPAPALPATSARPAAQSGRGRVACQRCHLKKTRCDASDRLPCSNCAGKSLECVLVESRRGRHVRKRRTPQDQRPKEKPVYTTVDTRGLPASANPQSYGPLTNGDHASQPVLNTVSPPRSNRVVSPSLSDDESPDMLYAQVAERSVNANDKPMTDLGDSVFLGETFSLTYVVHDVLAPFLSKEPLHQRCLHVSIPDNPGMKHQGRSPLHQDDQVAANQARLLKERKIFHRLAPEILQQLLDVYFDYFHYAYPIVERSEYHDAAQAVRRSQLVLNSLLMVATTLCEEEILIAGGFKDRHVARSAFYRQARLLYDADAEPDKLNNIRALFLMSFWWGRPNDLKDSWYWLGMAISIAKSLGLHRTTTSSNFGPRKSQLWKRLWWSLQIRDVLVSASLGRPRHIWQGDCDVEEPGPADVSEQFELGDHDAAGYFIQLAKLSTLISRILDARYGSARSIATFDHRTSLEDAMLLFHEQIPSELVYRGIDSSSGRGLWASMLLMTYNYAMILLCRPPLSQSGPEQFWEWGNTQKAFAAASAITRSMEDLLSASLVRLCQVQTITALFNALAVHVYSICTSQAANHDLAEMRAKVCMLGLASMQESWPVGGWVLKLFDRIMQRLKAPAGHDNQPIKDNEQSRHRSKSEKRAEGRLVPSPGISSDSGERFGSIIGSGVEEVSSPDQANQEKASSEATQVAFGAATTPQPTPEMALDFSTSLFSFDDAMAHPAFDQEKFFQWLDLPVSQDVDSLLKPA